MKKAWKLVLCLALAVAMLSCAALAAEAPEVAVATGMETNGITVATDGTVTVNVPAAMVTQDEQYVVILVKPSNDVKAMDAATMLTDARYALGEDTILYIDQRAAESTGLSITGKPKSMASCLVVLGGKSAAGETVDARVIGAIKTKGVTVTGTVTAKGATSGTATVAMGGETAEATIGTDGTGTYELVVPELGEMTVSMPNYATRTYTPEAETQNVELCHYGDVNNDGNLTITDVSQLYAHFMETRSITDAYKIECGKGVASPADDLTITDVSQLYAHFMQTRQIAAWNGWGIEG